MLPEATRSLTARPVGKSATAMKSRKKNDVSLLDSDPLWYKDAIIYEIHARAFRDSNGDGIGDLRGLIEKLDCLQGRWDAQPTATKRLPRYDPGCWRSDHAR